MDRRERPGVAGIQRLKQIEGFPAPYLADDDPVRPMSEGADGANDGHACVQATLRDDQPMGLAGALDRGAAVLLTEYEEQILACFRRGIPWQRLLTAAATGPRHKDVQPRGHAADRQERRAEPQGGVRVVQA